MSSHRVVLLLLFFALGCERTPASRDRETLDLTLHEGTNLGFDISPDGRSIVFDLLGQLWLLPAEGGTARALTDAVRDTAEDLNPSFLPDGRRVVFQGERAGRIGLWMVDLATGRPLLVTALDPDAEAASPFTIGGAPAIGASWARDGHALAWISPDSAGAMRLWVRKQGAAPRRIVPELEVAPTRVRWTPDSRALVYSAKGRLWRIADTGGVPVEIPFTASLRVVRARPPLPPARFPEPGVESPARGFTGLAIAPDGRSAAMIALGRLWQIPLDGGAPRSVAEVSHAATGLAWRPDGREVAYSAGPSGEEHIWITSIENGAARVLTHLAGRQLYPTWSPDGTRLAFVSITDSSRLMVLPGATPIVTEANAALNLGSIPEDGTTPPVWSPASDGLLVAGRARYRAKSLTEFVPLQGARIRIDSFPDAPIFLQWLPDTITFIRHDRLWRAAFDKTGLRSASVPLGSAPALYLSASSEGSLLFVSEGGLRVRRPGGTEASLGWPVKFTPAAPAPLLVRNVRIIDGTGAAPSAPRDILIDRGRITRIGEPGAIHSDARVLDGAGRVLIPGLMDLHAHFYRPVTLPSFAYFGVTTVRDQGSSMAPLVAFADMVSAGVLPGPRVAYGGFQFYSDWPFDEDQGRGIEPEADTAHVARAIALAAAFGAQHIKTRTFRRWDINARMIEAAHRRGMRATGHCSHELPLVLAGMDAKEHSGFCGARGDGDIYDDLLQLYRAAGIAVVPTISYITLAVRVNEDSDRLYADTSLAPFLPSREDFGWMLALRNRAAWARDGARARAVTLKLHRAGIAVGLGTDVWQVPTAVHMELEELVAAGLTPVEAIQAATGTAARVIGAEGDFGTIREGMRADLILLDADPTTDIRNTRKIAWVLKDGAIVDREAIRKSVSSK